MPSFQDYTAERLGRVEKIPTYLTLNEPILLFNKFRIYEVASSLGIVVAFGVIKSDWFLTLSFVALILIGSPAIRKRIPPTYIYRMILDRFSKLPRGQFTWGHTQSIF